MPTVRIRYTATQDDVRVLMHAIEAIEGIEHVEEVADLMPHMDDTDSSSAGLSDLSGPDSHELEIETSNPSTTNRVREAVEALAFDLDVLVEFEHDEG